MSKTYKIAFAAVLVALGVILTRFLGITTEIIYIGIGELPIYLAGILLGPIWGFCTGALVDVVGHFLKPMGAYFPGFTLGSGLIGLLAGLFLYKNRSLNIWKITLTVAAAQILNSLILTPLWLSILYKKGFWLFIPGRLLEQGFLLVVYPLLLFVLVKALRKLPLQSSLNQKPL